MIVTFLKTCPAIILIRKVFSVIFAVVFLCFSGGFSSAESEIIYEQYYLIKSKGVKTGFVHVSQRKKRIDGNLPAIVTQKHIEQHFKRLDNVIKIVQEQTFIEDEAGKPIQFSYKLKNMSKQKWSSEMRSGSKYFSLVPLEKPQEMEGNEDIRFTGRFDQAAEQIIVNSMVNGIKDSQIIDFDEKILFPYAIDKLYRETTDDDFKYFTIEPGINFQVLNVRVNKLKEDLIEVKGIAEKYIKYKTRVSLFSNTDIFEWRDENGRVVREYTSILDTEQIAVDKNDVLEIPSVFDVFSESFIKVNKTIPNPDRIDQVIYKITSADTLVDDIFMSDANQKIIQIKDNTVFLKVNAEYNRDKFSYPVILKQKWFSDSEKIQKAEGIAPSSFSDYKAEKFNQYLKSGAFIITDSPRIKNLADELKYGETDALYLAKKMQNWVYENVRNKNFSLDFANSVKTLETGSGDCAEHAILLAALLRAAGIPSKVVIGLVYTNKPYDAFMYHMWVKAFVGKWVSLDASLPYRDFTPLSLAMKESSLNNISEKADLILSIMRVFSKLDIEFLNISKPVTAQTDGKLEIKVNLNNRNLLIGNNFVDINMDKNRPVKSRIQEINFPIEKEKDNIKEAFYSFTRGNTENALEELKEFHETIDSEDDFLKIKLALKLIHMSYFNFASEVLEEVEDKEIWGVLINDLYSLYCPRKLFPDDKEKLQVAAFYALNYKNDPDFALELTQNIKKYDYIYYLRAKAFIKKSDLEEAKKEIKRAIKINPDNLTYNLELIKILSSQNEIYKAQEKLNHVNLVAKKQNIQDKEFWKNFKIYDYWLKVKQFRENPALSKYYEAHYYLTKGETDFALGILNKLVYSEKESYLYELLADIYYNLDQFDAAQKYYIEALYIDENKLKSNLGLGNINFLCGNTDKAQEYYEKVLSTRPNNVETLLYMSKLQKYLGNDEKSYEYFKKILALDKENVDVLYNVGIILANRSEFKKAEKIFKKVLSADPMREEIWLDLAKLKLAEGYHDKAAEYLRNVKYLNENNPYYYYFMGLILGEQPEEAKKYFKRAYDLKPDLANEL